MLRRLAISVFAVSLGLSICCAGSFGQDLGDDAQLKPSAEHPSDVSQLEQPASASEIAKPFEQRQADAEKLQAAVDSAYKPLYFNNDFSFIDNPAYDVRWFGDRFKQLPVGPFGKWDIGGNYLLRYHHEQNHRGLGLTGNDDHFLLHQSRLFINAPVNDWFRAYAEFLDAESGGEDFASRNIEVNRTDFLNLFGDVLLVEGANGKWTARGGRQELLYGAQRLVSPLPWGVTRRTFEGAKVFGNWGDTQVDAFWTHPVAISPHHFDGVIDSQEFSGIYLTHKAKDQVWDAYWLRYLESDAAGFALDTFGGRTQGNRGDWLWDCEAAIQTGEVASDNHLAGFWVAGGGYRWSECSWKPTVWTYYDWASGDETLGNGFHHLFPLAHKYNGFMDLFGRRNLEDANVLLTFDPADHVQVSFWYHLLHLQDGNDVPYNVNMTPFTTTVGGSQYLGQELDSTVTWKLNSRADWLFGYSHFFAGSYYDTNPAVPFAGNADFFYSQFEVKF